MANPQLRRLIERLAAARAQSSECCPRCVGAPPVSRLSPIFSIATTAEKSSARPRSQPMNTPAKLRGER